MQRIVVFFFLCDIMSYSFFYFICDYVLIIRFLGWFRLVLYMLI